MNSNIEKTIPEEGFRYTPHEVIEKFEADPSLKDNKEFALDCLRHNCFTFQLFSDAIKDNHDIAKEAVSDFGDLFLFISKRLQQDRDLVLLSVTKRGSNLQFVAPQFKEDKEIILAALAQDTTAIAYAPEQWKKDKDVILKLIADDKMGAWDARTVLKEASNELQDDKAVVLAAVKKYGLALQYASDRLRKDREVVCQAILEDHYAIDYARTKIKQKIEALMLEKGFKDIQETAKYMLDTLTIQQENTGIRQTINRDELPKVQKIKL